jgi:hypothetical protein
LYIITADNAKKSETVDLGISDMCAPRVLVFGFVAFWTLNSSGFIISAFAARQATNGK